MERTEAGDSESELNLNPHKPNQRPAGTWRCPVQEQSSIYHRAAAWWMLPWLFIQAGLWFWSQFPQSQSYRRSLPFPRIFHSKNWLWNQNVRALQKCGQRKSFQSGVPPNGSPMHLQWRWPKWFLGISLSKKFMANNLWSLVNPMRLQPWFLQNGITTKQMKVEVY